MFQKALHKLIYYNRTTLKKLNFMTTGRLAGRVIKVLSNLAKDGKGPLNLTSFGLTWTWDTGETPYTRSPHELKLLEFLKSQPNLTSVFLPPLKSQSRIPAAAALPLQINGTFGTNFGAIATVELLQKLLEAESMKFNFHPFPGNDSTNFVNAAANTVFPVLRSLSVKGEMRQNLTSTIIRSFPNLVKLEVVCSNELQLQEVVRDELLQSIVQNLVNLQTLILGPCNRITDFGVAGIRTTDSRQLLESRSLYLERKLTELGMERIGVSISDLKGKFICVPTAFHVPIPISHILQR